MEFGRASRWNNCHRAITVRYAPQEEQVRAPADWPWSHRAEAPLCRNIGAWLDRAAACQPIHLTWRDFRRFIARTSRRRRDEGPKYFRPLGRVTMTQPTNHETPAAVLAAGARPHAPLSQKFSACRSTTPGGMRSGRVATSCSRRTTR